jgi:actin-related protein
MNSNSSTDVVMNDENQQRQQETLVQQQLAVGIISRKQKDEFQQSKRMKLSNPSSSVSSSSSAQMMGRTLERYINWHRANQNDWDIFLKDQLTMNPLANMVCDCAYQCDRDQQGQLLSSIVLGGGGACTFGPTENALPDLIKENVETLIHTHTPGWRVKIYTPTVSSERSILSWLGGSILGSLNAFQNMYITKAEYDEWGPAIVNRKCP